MPTPDLPEHYTRAFSKQEINAMPLRRWEGPVEVVRTENQRTKALKELEGEPLLGFDTETRPVFKKGRKPNPPALLQLATAQRVFLFQINLLPMSNGLLDLLAEDSIIKTGVAVRDDIAGLQKLADFTPGGFIDLSDISAQSGMQTHGLRNMAANLLGFRISKSA